MDWELLIQSFLLILMPILAVVIVELKNLLYAAIVLGGESVVLAVIFYMLKAPDIAITQAAVGAGISTMLFVFAISKTRREE